VKRWLKRILVGALAFVLLAAGAFALAVYGWKYPAWRLAPDHGQPLLVTASDGTLLRAVPGVDGRRAAWTSLDAIPPLAIDAVIASEDDRFWAHGGVDPRGVARAAWLDVKGGRFGGSTIAMQLVRMVDDPGKPRTLWNKLREAVLAMRLERSMSRREILEQYLNRAFYANGAVGLEAAAELYFGKPAAALSPGEATLLAVIPRSPHRYDPIDHLGDALTRRDHVLGLLVAKGYLDPDEAERARVEPLAPALHAPPFQAAHFVDWVIASLPDDVRRTGGEIRTTLDAALQESLERRVAEHTDALAGRGVDQAGVVVLDSQTGEVRAMVGSAGFADEQVNLTIRRRHPGSALKPFVYALALEAGDTPATIALDANDAPGSAFHLIRPTQREHGPVRYREALAGSYNLAAVHVLEKVGVERLMDKLAEAGAAKLDGTPDEYGLQLALGSAKVRLADLAAAYGFLVRGGRTTRASGVASATLADGRTWQPARAEDRRIFSPEVSWLVMDMLSDAASRRPAFGMELPFDDLGYDVAAKTGTSRGFADTVAVAVTNEVTVAAWAGGANEGVIAMKAAAPLVREALLAEGRPLTLPARPASLVAEAVCTKTGARSDGVCPSMREWFVPGTESASR
jgi:penicillin-binding protein 1C